MHQREIKGKMSKRCTNNSKSSDLFTEINHNLVSTKSSRSLKIKSAPGNDDCSK